MLEAVEEAVSEDAFNQLAFVRRSAFDTNRERKTVIIGQSDDFRSFAAARDPLGVPRRELLGMVRLGGMQVLVKYL